MAGRMSSDRQPFFGATYQIRGGEMKKLGLRENWIKIKIRPEEKVLIM